MSWPGKSSLVSTLLPTQSRGVKIQVGERKRTNPQSQAATSSSTSQSSSSSSAAVPSFPTAKLTLLEICDSHYMRKNCKRRKKKNENSNPSENNQQPINKPPVGGNAGSLNQALNKQRGDEQSSSSSGGITAGGGPRVEIINGKIVIKESSLVVNQDTTFADGDYEEVVEGTHATATYSSFTKRRPAKRWGLEETRLFYQTLRQCGTDFSIMQTFFPGRTRDQLKKKFFREELQHPELIRRTLNTTLPLELKPFEVQLGVAMTIDGDDNKSLTNTTKTASIAIAGAAIAGADGGSEEDRQAAGAADQVRTDAHDTYANNVNSGPGSAGGGLPEAEDDLIDV